MRKFQVGDIVRRIRRDYDDYINGSYTSIIKIGDIGIVLEILTDDILMIRYFNGIIRHNDPLYLEIVKGEEI